MRSHARDVVVLASEGLRVTPGTLVAAIGAGAVPVVSRLEAYVELLENDGFGLEFEPSDAETLGHQLARLVSEPRLRRELANSASPCAKALLGSRGLRARADYGELASRRHDGADPAGPSRRLQSRPLIDVDLHMHTDHSPDCATPVEVLLAEAKERGLGAIAVTDHNEIRRTRCAREGAGIKVIVAEEIKTADQGEVIGLFIKERIPRGCTLQETISEIKRQGGLVHAPHPSTACTPFPTTSIFCRC